MKLCFLLASYNKFGGVERVVINLANLLSKKQRCPYYLIFVLR